MYLFVSIFVIHVLTLLLQLHLHFIQVFFFLTLVVVIFIRGSYNCNICSCCTVYWCKLSNVSDKLLVIPRLKVFFVLLQSLLIVTTFFYLFIKLLIIFILYFFGIGLHMNSITFIQLAIKKSKETICYGFSLFNLFLLSPLLNDTHAHIDSTNLGKFIVMFLIHLQMLLKLGLLKLLKVVLHKFGRTLLITVAAGKL